MNILKFIEKKDILAIDTETTGLSTRQDRVIGLGISDDFTGFYILPDDPILPEVLQALKKKKLVMWNAYFDLEMIRNSFGVDLWDSLYLDGIILKHTVDEIPPFKLKEVAVKLYGPDAASEQEDLHASIKANGGKPNEFAKADIDILSKYCIQDCKLTYKICNYYLNKLKYEKLESFFFEEEVMPLYKEVTRTMQSKGIPLDMESLLKSQIEITRDIMKLEDEIQNEIDPLLDEFREWFFSSKFPASRTGKFAQKVIDQSPFKSQIPKTPTGKYRTTIDVLSQFDDKCGYIEFLTNPEVSLYPEEVTKIQNQLWQEVNEERYPFNLSSKDHLKRLFFTKLNEKPVTKTKKGNPQVNEFFLQDMAEKYSWANKLQDFNKLCKLKGSYIDRFIDKQEGGIFYPSYFQHRTISGRYGSDLQQLPRKAEEGQFSPIVTKYRNIIRDFFISGPGYKFIDADYESLEPHIFAHISGEDSLKDIFKYGEEDFYSKIAIQVEKLSDYSAKKSDPNFLKKINPGLRQRAKAYALGIPYGMEGFALGKTLDIHSEEGEELVYKYLQAFPKLANWMKESDEKMYKVGEIISEAGRKRRLITGQKLYKDYGNVLKSALEVWKKYHDDPSVYYDMQAKRRAFKKELNNAKNFQIQSLAASIVNRSAVELAKYLRYNKIDGYICAQVHDQLIVRVEESRALEVKEKMQEIMENTYKISVPLKAPAEIGTNFGETH